MSVSSARKTVSSTLPNPSTNTYPNARFLYLVRDPRDYALSFVKSIHGPPTYFRAAHRWRKEQRKCADQIKNRDLPALTVHYEDVVLETEQTMTRIFDFLGESVETAGFETGQSRTEAQRNALWRNLDKPIMRGNTKKYRDQLNSAEIRIIESTAADMMAQLKYPLETDAAWRKTTPFLLRDRLRGTHNKRLARRKHADTVRLLADRDRLRATLEKEAGQPFEMMWLRSTANRFRAVAVRAGVQIGLGQPPGFLIIGTQKGGTDALMRYLNYPS